MTELYIDDKIVALPAEFSLTILDQNPFITRNGEFTLDIELSLAEINNALLYHGIERLNSGYNISNRKALLYCDNHLVLSGKEVILSNTENAVSIQLVAGNSELNYLSNSSGLIRDLDLGDIPIFTPAQARESWSGSYPEKEWVCAPAKAFKTDGKPIFLNNLLGSQLHIVEGKLEMRDRDFWSTQEHITPMPYLFFIVDKIAQSIGYSIGNNALLATEYRRLFIPTGIQGAKITDLFGDITIGEFISQIEQLFDVAFILEADSRKINIEFRKGYFSNDSHSFETSNILDNYERQYLSENINVKGSSGMAYDFGSGGKDNYYKYQDVNKNVYDSLQKMEFDDMAAINSYITGANEELKKKLPGYLFVDKAKKTDYIIDDSTTLSLKRINIFKQVLPNIGTDVVSMFIIPAQVEHFSCLCKTFASGSQYFYKTFNILIPIVTDYNGQTEDNAVIAKELINTGITDRKPDNILPVAFWNGGLTLSIGALEGSGASGKIDFCQPTTHYYAPWDTSAYTVIDNTFATMAFNSDGMGIAEKFWDTTSFAEASKEYTIRFYSTKWPDVRGRFLLYNRPFICKQLEYTISNDGISPIITGTFLPVIV